MQKLPSGTVTFFFSDIEGSTRLWETYPQGMKTALQRHDRLISQAVEENNGQVIKTTGDGFHAGFETAASAARAAILAQQALARESWDEIRPDQIRIRIGLHTGEASQRANDYFGSAVNRAARLMAVGHGGQILLSTATADLLRDELPEGALLLDLGEHRLKDLVRPEGIFQLAHADLPRDFPPLNTLDVFPNNLPVQLTSYIGREKEMDEVRQLLASTRLLTLVGPGGIGKTRLAIQVAAEMLATFQGKVQPFPNGVWIIELAAVTNPSQVVGEIASTFELRETQGGPNLLEMIVNFLRAKKLLLLFDNCEHIIEECARLADSLLRACQGIKMLVSSREALGISGEVIYRVPSLSLPELDHSQPAALLKYEAVQLFIERAQAAQPRFMVTEQNAPALARICQRLDGIPLALELAAARVSVFTADQIASRLDDRFRLLTGGSRTALPRQQTLRALIDWSYDLLSPPERTLFQRLSVFVGGWSIEAAEQVCGDEGSGTEPDSLQAVDILDLLSHLVNKSLVIVSQQEGETRYSFLETIRQYAQEQFHAHDKTAGTSDIIRVRSRHLAYYLGLSRGGTSQFLMQGIQWLNLMDTEYENLRAAFEWGLESDPEAALDLIGELFLYVDLRTDLHEAKAAVQEAISRVERLPSVDGADGKRRITLRAKGYLAYGQFCMSLGETVHAMAWLNMGSELARSVGNLELLQWSLGLISVDAVFTNEIERMHRASSELVKSSGETAKGWFVAVGKAMLSWSEGALGHLELRDALAKEALAAMGQVENPMTLNGLMMMGLEARIRGSLETARNYLEKCLPYTKMVKSRTYTGMVRSELAHIDRQMGNIEKAKETYRVTILIWNDLGHLAAVSHQLECFALLAIAEKQFKRAALLFGAAEALREKSSSSMTAYEETEYQPAVEQLHQELTQEEFEHNWSEGKLLSIDQAISTAIETSPQSGAVGEAQTQLTGG